MEIRYYTLTVAIFMLLCGSAQEIKVPESLKINCEVYSVKGRWGKQFNQVITFGEYSTSKIKKGWTKTTTVSSSTPLNRDVVYQDASQKFSFEQYYSSDLKADVICSGKLSSLYMEVVKNLFSVGTDFQNVFSGNILIIGADSLSWDFSVNNPGQMPDIEGNTSGAIIRNGEMPILMYAVSEIEGKKIPKFLQSLYGYVFEQNDEPIGAVSLYNKGVVTIKKGLDEERQLVIAAVSTAMLVRQDLDE